MTLDGKIRTVSLGLALALGLAAGAAAPVESTVAAHRQKAAKLAAARKWDLALAEISLARRALQDDRRRNADHVKVPPALLKELAELRQWYRSQMQAAQSGKADPARVAEQYRKKRIAAARKYGMVKPRPVNTAATAAQRDLLIADLDDTAATYHRGKGQSKQATFYRQSALMSRLSAYQVLKKEPQAAQVAGQLQAINSPDPRAYRVVAQFYQGRKEFPHAAGVWQKGIGLLESGKATLRARRGTVDADRERGFYLSEFYRELAFCLNQQGKAADARLAMQKAAQNDPSANK